MAYDWKPAGAGEEGIEWILYDFGAGSHAASVTVTLFDQAETAATNTYQDTDMDVAGQLTATHRFRIDKIAIIPDNVAAATNANDTTDAFDQATMELVINNKRVFIAPAGLLVGRNATVAETVASNAMMTQVGMEAYELDIPIVIPGATPFKITLTQGLTDTAADFTFGVALIGELVRPS